MRSFIFAVSLWLLVFATSHATSNDVLAKLEKTSRRDSETKSQVFPVSTEMEIGKAWPILRKAPKGIYLSIGSERSFRGASMIPDATALVVIDVSPDILKFVEINRELLKAPDLAAYRRLRVDASFGEWRAFCKSMGNSDCLTEKDFEWWVSKVRDRSKMLYPLPEDLNRASTDYEYQKALLLRRTMESLHGALKSPENLTVEDLMQQVPFPELEKMVREAGLTLEIASAELEQWRKSQFGERRYMWGVDFGYALDAASIVDFETGNYLFDEDLYNRLHRLATAEKIYAIQTDLSDLASLSQLKEAIKEFGQQISVLDLDAVSPAVYIGDKAFLVAVRTLLDAGTDSSILMMTWVPKRIDFIDMQSYMGFRFSFVKTWRTDFRINSYILSLPKEIAPHFNGKLYSESALPPYFDTWEKHPPKVYLRFNS